MKAVLYTVFVLGLLALCIKFKDKIYTWLGVKDATQQTTSTASNGLLPDSKIIPSYSGVITTAPLDGIGQNDTGAFGVGGGGLLGTATLNQQEPLNQQNTNAPITKILVA